MKHYSRYLCLHTMKMLIQKKIYWILYYISQLQTSLEVIIKKKYIKHKICNIKKCVFITLILLLQSWKWASEKNKHLMDYIKNNIVPFPFYMIRRSYSEYTFMFFLLYNEFKNNFIKKVKTDKNKQKKTNLWEKVK